MALLRSLCPFMTFFGTPCICLIWSEYSLRIYSSNNFVQDGTQCDQEISCSSGWRGWEQNKQNSALISDLGRQIPQIPLPSKAMWTSCEPFFLSRLGDSRQRQQWWLGDCKGGWEAVEVLPNFCQRVNFHFSSSCHMSLSWIDDDCENRNSDWKALLGHRKQLWRKKFQVVRHLGEGSTGHTAEQAGTDQSKVCFLSF